MTSTATLPDYVIQEVLLTFARQADNDANAGRTQAICLVSLARDAWHTAIDSTTPPSEQETQMLCESLQVGDSPLPKDIYGALSDLQYRLESHDTSNTIAEVGVMLAYAVQQLFDKHLAPADKKNLLAPHEFALMHFVRPSVHYGVQPSE